MHMLIGCPAAPPCDVFISVMDRIRDYEKEKIWLESYVQGQHCRCNIISVRNSKNSILS